MKNLSKKLIVLTMIVLIVLAGATKVNAAGSVTMTSSSKLKAGETVTISVNIASGLAGFSGKLSYDTSVFESATMVANGNWNVNLSNSTNIATVDRETAATATEQVATITLKVKSDYTPKTTTVKITNIKESDGNATLATGGSASVTFEVEKEPQSESSEGTKNPVKENTAKENTTKTNTTKTSKNITTSKTTSKKLPKAGDAVTIVITATVAVIAIVGIVGFVRFAKNKDVK